MKVVEQNYEILDQIDGQAILKKLELIARTCYKSEDKIKEGSAERMVSSLIKSGHHAMLEHVSLSVKFICDRGISHEIVRHRLASFAQESTRYCNYGKGDGIAVIMPPLEMADERAAWSTATKASEDAYMYLVHNGISPQLARSVLPTCLKTELVMTANLREWRHFFSLRAVGTTGKPHPQLQELALMLLYDLAIKIPVVFDDLVEQEGDCPSCRI